MNQTFKSLGLFIILAAIAFLFLELPLPLLSSKEGVFRRGLLFFLPLADAPFCFHQVWGKSFVWFDIDRIKIMGIGLFELASVLGAGRFIFHILQRSFRKQTNQTDYLPKEKCFISFLLGSAVVSAYLFWAGFIGWISKMTALPLLLFGISEIILWFKAVCGSASVLRNSIGHGISCRLKMPGVLNILVVLLALDYLLAGTIPPFEYDMLEYHAQGAREIFETGRISFAEHNVYLNMPLGAEMFYLAGILLSPFKNAGNLDALCIGVTGGKFFLAFTPLFCALGAALFARRLTEDRDSSQLLQPAAALSVLAMPEIFQVSANGLNDVLLGLMTLGTVYVLFTALQKEPASNGQNGLLFISGITAGFAAACKYTAIPFTVLPSAVFIFLFSLRNIPRRRCLMPILCFSAGSLAAGGGWYIKNLILTGNPFYPLAFTFFGDRTGAWTLAKNARWNAAHSAHSFGISDFLTDITRILTDNFTSLILPLFTILLILFLPGIFRRSEKRSTFFPVLYLSSFLFLWWFFTHRLIRFLVPALPLAGAIAVIFWYRGYSMAEWKPLRRCYFLLWGACALYALLLNLISVPGILAPVNLLANDPQRYGTAAVALAQCPPEDEFHPVLLLIGDARGFAYRNRPILYNTCWDNSRMADFLPKGKDNLPLLNWTEDQAAEIKQKFHLKRIGMVLVDRNEINRFLSSGNYGLTDKEYTDQAIFENLVKYEVLERLPSPSGSPHIEIFRIKNDSEN